MNNFTEITQQLHAKNTIQNLHPRDLLLFSETSMRKLGKLTTRATLVDGRDFHSNMENIDNFINHLSEGDIAVYTFGGGTVIDAGKYIAEKINARLTCILPMLSTNTFATDKVSLYTKDDLKITLQARIPDEIILDMDLLKAAGYKNLLGLSEILSIHTALYDWSLGTKHTGEFIDNIIYDTALGVLSDLEDNIEVILSSDNSAITLMYELIGRSGEITRMYGSGRPESGSEHIFAKVIEKELNIPHGLAVAIGVISMSMLQNNNPGFVIDLLKKIGTIRLLDSYKVTNEDIALALSHVKKIPSRFTILDIETIDKDFIEKVLTQLDRLR